MTDDGKTAEDAGGARVGASPATMREVGGSAVEAFNMMIARQTSAALCANPASDEDQRTTAAASFAALVSVAPRSELEGMLGAQLVACHNAAMECFRRAAHPGQHTQARAENLAHAGRLSRAYAALVEALDRRRSEGLPRTVVVEHRVVREGVLDASPAPAPRIPAPRVPSRHKGNGHDLNGHTAAGGAALP
jgi:hypothetical protein